MLVLDNRTPYAAERNWVRDPSGAHHWVVAVKATFDIALDGSLRLADEQPPPLLAPEHWGEPGLSSLRYEADLGPAKPNTDVLVNGHAHAPRGRPATEVPVALRFPGVEKTLVVSGDSVYHQGLGNRSKTSPSWARPRYPSSSRRSSTTGSGEPRLPTASSSGSATA